MRTDTKPRPIEQACSFDIFLSALNDPASAFVGTPRTLRDGVAARQFGDFGTVLMAERPASAELSERVQRWRTIDVTAREDAPFQAHPDQSVDARRFQFVTALTAVVIIGWIVFSVLIAGLAGKVP